VTKGPAGNSERGTYLFFDISIWDVVQKADVEVGRARRKAAEAGRRARCVVSMPPGPRLAHFLCRRRRRPAARAPQVFFDEVEVPSRLPRQKMPIK
jgi:hypothetical protein